MQNNILTISFSGDVLLSQRIPAAGYEGREELKQLLQTHECNIANLETTVHRSEGYPESFPGGGYAMADPLCLKDLKDMGFNFFSAANNHAMDYGHGGLLATMKYLKDYELPYAGIGANLSEASRPAYFETSAGRVALLGITSSFHDSYAEGHQNKDLQGRPSVAPLKHKAIYELSGEHFDALQEIAHATGINSYHNRAVKSGYLVASDNFKFGSYEFKRGRENKVNTYPNPQDLQRTLNAIDDAKFKSDFVVISIHSHQIKGENRWLSPDFITDFSKKCIEQGADVVICHGPHVMRGVEIYQNGVIFHGLGNLILQHEAADVLPEDFYQKYGENSHSVSGVAGIYNKRSKNATIGLATQPDVWKTIIVSLTRDETKTAYKIHPIEVQLKGKKGMQGLPKLSKDPSILKHLQELSSELGTQIHIADNIGTITIPLNNSSH
ncbi:MAG: CapA family protein [Akkermansia sp.]